MGRFGPDACGDADEGHGEERGEVVEVGFGVDVAVGLAVAQGVAKGTGEPVEGRPSSWATCPTR